jgi:hypothetical protein
VGRRDPAPDSTVLNLSVRETIDASLHARVDCLRAVVIGLVRRSSQFPALCPESEVVRDPPGERYVRAIERQRPLRPERHAHHRFRRAG